MRKPTAAQRRILRAMRLGQTLTYYRGSPAGIFQPARVVLGNKTIRMQTFSILKGCGWIEKCSPPDLYSSEYRLSADGERLINKAGETGADA